MRRAVLLLVLFPLAVRADLSSDLERLAEEVRKQWKVPGCAVVVIRGDQTLVLAGFGSKQLGKPDPVTADTLFGIGSLTKAITATALARLVEEGKLDWDDPVRKHVPFFRLQDPLADRDVTIRDLLCHRVGIARHDLIWRSASWDLEESVRRMAHLEQTIPFRSGYLYNNLTYITLGLVIRSASGMPWDQYVQKELFQPLGMAGVVFTRSAMVRTKDRSHPHVLPLLGDAVEVIDWYDDDKQVRASGSVKASVRDMEKWLRFQLSGGSWQGKQIVSRESLRETHRPQVVTPTRALYVNEAGTTQSSYGLGWHLRDHRGHFVMEHGGSVDGFMVHQILAPRQKVAVAVLGNLGSSAFPMALCYGLLDRTLELPAKDWSGILLRAQKDDRDLARKREEAWQKRRQLGTKPSRELSAYEGEYVHPAYGKAEVRFVDGKLSLRWSGFQGPLVHFHHDTWTFEQKGRIQSEVVTFTLGPDGEPARLQLLGQDFRRLRR